jgi:hypothetical protein
MFQTNRKDIGFVGREINFTFKMSLNVLGNHNNFVTKLYLDRGVFKVDLSIHRHIYKSFHFLIFFNLLDEGEGDFITKV